jgi:outer membrane protein assembly factor BamD
MNRRFFSRLANTGVSFILVLSLFSACTTTQPKKPSGPRELLNDAIFMVKNKDIEEAKAAFKQVMEDYPDSEERIAALFYLADLQFKDEEYEEAKFHFQRFTELYPAHKNVDRAYYYKAMSDFKMIEISSRDQSHTHKAIEAFDRLIQGFPESQYRPPAIEKKNVCLQTLAKSVFEIGKFYFRTGGYQSAISRFKELAEQYPGHKFQDEAIFLTGESYFMEQNFEEAKEFYRSLLQQHPKSAFAKDARKRLKTLR